MNPSFQGVRPSDVCGHIVERAGFDGHEIVDPAQAAVLDQHVRVLRSLGLRRVTVSSTRRSGFGESLSALVHHGIGAGLSPIDGIVAAMRVTPARHLFVVASDLTSLDRSILLTLLRRCGPTSGVTLRVRARVWDPLCSVYPPNCLSIAEAEARRRGSPQSLLATLLSAGRISGLDLSGPGETTFTPPRHAGA